jgi:hypothetical protein
MTNDQFPNPNGAAILVGNVTQRQSRGEAALVMGDWDLVIPAIIRERVRE